MIKYHFLFHYLKKLKLINKMLYEKNLKLFLQLLIICQVSLAFNLRRELEHKINFKKDITSEFADLCNNIKYFEQTVRAYLLYCCCCCNL
jgi:hypothetical protein